jgi:WD40-like Beta Propeller Repeat
MPVSMVCLTARITTLAVLISSPFHVWADDAPKIEGKASPGRLYVLAEKRLPPVPGELPFPGIVAAEPGKKDWALIGDPELTDGVVSRDGRYLAAGLSARSGPTRFGVWIFDVSGNKPSRRVFSRPWFACCWGGEDKEVIVSAPAEAGFGKFETFRVPVDGDGIAKTRMPIPENEVVMDCSRDGKWLASFDLSAVRDGRARINLMRPDGTDRHAIVDEPGNARYFRISPDGKRVVYALATGEPRQPNTTLWFVDADGKNRKAVPFPIEPGLKATPVWSPDGTRLAVGTSKVGRGQNLQIVTIDADGKNSRTQPSPPGGVTLLDWK